MTFELSKNELTGKVQILKDFTFEVTFSHNQENRAQENEGFFFNSDGKEVTLIKSNSGCN